MHPWSVPFWDDFDPVLLWPIWFQVANSVSYTGTLAYIILQNFPHQLDNLFQYSPMINHSITINIYTNSRKFTLGSIHTTPSVCETHKKLWVCVKSVIVSVCGFIIIAPMILSRAKKPQASEPKRQEGWTWICVCAALSVLFDSETNYSKTIECETEILLLRSGLVNRLVAQ